MLARRTLTLTLLLLLLGSSLAVRAQQPTAPAASPNSGDDIPFEARAKIAPDLLARLLQAESAVQSDGHAAQPTRYIVHLVERADLADIAGVNDVPTRRAALVERLQRTARLSQTPLLALLARRSADGAVAHYSSLWIVNAVVVQGDLQTALQLALRSDVAELRLDREHQLALPAPLETDVTPQALPWNIARIGADRVWSELGVTGEGVVIASMDTGVDWTHPALQRQYRGFNPAEPAASTHHYNWFDPSGTYPTAPGPNVPGLSTYSDHGTHTVGTLVGATADGVERVGVAPGAQWIAVKIFTDTGSSYDSWIHQGFQWCLAPTRLDGSDPDPSRAPDIVNNSWGDDEHPGDTEFGPDVATLRAAGIMTVFAAGNAGPVAGTVGSPASIHGVYAVGATDGTDAIASFSGRGPSPWGETKPDIAAPGVAVRSSIAGGGYGTLQGTSMACPHVAGLAALLWSADSTRGAPTLAGAAGNPTLTITATEQLIADTSVDLGATGKDNVYGEGRIDAYAAVSALLQTGSVAGVVSVAGTGMPVADAVVTLTQLSGGAQNLATTAADGSYVLAATPGNYALSVTRYGYAVESVPSVQVEPAAQTRVDLALEPLPLGTLRGRVSSASTGLPVPARVSAVDTPVSATVDAQGFYTLTVEAGPCTVVAMPLASGLRGRRIEGLSVPADGALQQDIALDAAPRLLLVDADAWAAPQAQAYGAALDALLYVYDVHALLTAPDDVPSAAVLADYDIVIWAQPQRSPGFIGAWETLGSYLDGGGHLLISGQNIAFWDDGQNRAPTAFRTYLHSEYVSSNAGLGALWGVEGGALEGFVLRYAGAGSDGAQTDPDAIRLRSSAARPLLRTSSGETAALLADACAYRAAYLTFGLEGVGLAERVHTLEVLLDALWAERPPRAVSVTAPVLRQLAAPGATAQYRLWVTNTGQVTDSYTFTIDSPWPARLLDAASQLPIADSGALAPCATRELLVEVDVPRTAILSDAPLTRVMARSTLGASASLALQTDASTTWQAGPDLPGALSGHAAAAASCRQYVIGGHPDGLASVTGAVSVLDLSTGQWTTGHAKPTPVAHAGAAELGGRIYVVGGHNPAFTPAILANVEVYDPAADRWSSAPPLPVALSGAAVAAHNGRLYVFGGQTASQYSQAAYAYDPASGQWSTLAPLPVPDALHARAVSIGASLYVAGGWPDRTQLLRYDPATNTWTRLADLLTGRYGAAMTAADGRLYVAGGSGASTVLSSVERYDPDANTWQALAPLLTASHADTAGVYADGRMYVLGGLGTHASQATEILEISPSWGGSYLAAELPHVPVGGEVAYQLVVRNPLQIATTLSWTHRLPDGLDYAPGSATGGAVYSATTHELSYSGPLQAAAERIFEFGASVHPNVPDGTSITSTVHLTGGGCAERALVTTVRAHAPSLAASTKTVDRSAAQPGDILHYRVDLINSVPVTITGASLVDPLPPHTMLLPGSLTGGATYNPSLNRVEWSGEVGPAPTDAR
ncbi:MAG: S8 family serine peptidase, partial [Chloroflexi bacterium]|nr:S8 family serine peptidase [Chloroflexota bacterium]